MCIRLIACDIDGTLLQSGQTGIAEAVFTQIKRLRQNGILFCPASGRQYQSLRRLFAPVAEDIMYICENGSVVFDTDGKALTKTVIPRTDAMKLCHEILDEPNCEVLISGETTCYLVPRHDDVVHHIRDVIHNNTVILERVEDVPEDIIKIAAFCRDGANGYVNAFQSRWSDKLSVALGGKLWLDFTLADKGVGIKAVSKALDIPLSEIMAIGDNYNDLPILTIVGHPVIMENAADALKERFAQKCTRVEDTLAVL